MKDKELREILTYSDLIDIDNHGRLREKIHAQEKQIQDQQKQIDFMLKHLNLDIEKFEGYVEKA
jgi:hypothetical protein